MFNWLRRVVRKEPTVVTGTSQEIKVTFSEGDRGKWRWAMFTRPGTAKSESKAGNSSGFNYVCGARPQGFSTYEEALDDVQKLTEQIRNNIVLFVDPFINSTLVDTTENEEEEK